MAWKQYRGGQRWRVLEDGISVEVEGEGVLRTRGEPLTMRQMREDYGAELDAAAEHFGLPVEWIMAMVTIEAVRIKGTRTFDAASVREEPGFVSDKTTPRKVSVGLMQTLITTARSMQRRFKLYPEQRVDRAFLKDPGHSLMLGAAYMRRQLDRYDRAWGQDPVILTGSYNAGSLKKDKPDKKGRLNRYKIRTYGYARTDKYLRFLGDAVAVMQEERGESTYTHKSTGVIRRVMGWLFGGQQ